MNWLTVFFDWLFPVRLSPWRTCTNCGECKAKERMIRDLGGWYCDDHCQSEWDNKLAW